MNKRLKRFLSLAMGLIFLLALLPVGVLAEETASGACGDNLTWSLDSTGLLTISGYGAMPDYDTSEDGANPQPWISVRDSITQLRVERGVTELGGGAFGLCQNLVSISLPNSLTRIGRYAFFCCYALAEVTIPASVKTIDYGAFAYCDSVTRYIVESGNTAYTSDDGMLLTADGKILVAYPAACSYVAYKSSSLMTEIKEHVFSHKYNLEYVRLRSDLTRIPFAAFNCCYNLTSVSIPASVTEIEGYAFGCCSSLTDVYYSGSPAQWQAISVADGNESLQNAVIHYASVAEEIPDSSLTWIMDKNGTLTVSGSGDMPDYSLSFYDVPPWDWMKSLNGSVQKAVLKSGVTSVGNGAFSYCDNLKSVVLPKGVQRIGEWAFRGCSELTSINIPSTVTSIGFAAFYLCNQLTSVTLPTGMTSLGGWAFGACSGLKSITIPRTVTEIGDCAFYACDALTDVYFGGTEEDWGKISIGSDNESLTSANIHFTNPLAVSSVKADKTSADTGETITWTAKASGGSGTLKYYFILYKDGTKIKTRSYSTTKTFSYTPTEAGTYKVKVYVKDADDTKVYKNSTSVTVTAAAAGPVISSVKAGVTSAYAGEKITWTAAASGGSGTLKYYFILYKDGVKVKTRSYSTTNTFSYTPTEAGNYKVKVYVKDADGTKSYKTGGKVTVTLGPPAIISVKAGKTSSAVGEKITWTATAVGSEQPLKYYFILYKDGAKIKTRSYSTANTFSYTPTEAGTYKVKVYVKDAEGAKVYKNSAKLTVTG